MGRLNARLHMGIKRLVRPLVPDRWVTRVRLGRHSRQVRTNVDVVVDDERRARRWLATTPDTYRVRPSSSFNPGPEVTVTIIGSGDPPAGHEPVALAYVEPDPDGRRALLRPLADLRVAAVVLGEAEPPPVARGRRREPAVDPVAMAVRRSAWTEVGGMPAGTRPLAGLLARLRDAGHPLALVPLSPTGPPAPRSDPIAGRAAVVVLAAVPMHDVGGGSRGTQIALELLRRGYYVVHVALFGTAESTDLGLRHLHPRLEQLRANELSVPDLAARLKGPPGPAVVEIPAADYLLPARQLRGAGFRLVYDLIDDWTDPALGAGWYRPAVEAELADLADGLVASAPPLAERLVQLSDRDVTEVPNGVNAALFATAPGPVPDDFPAGDGPVIGYHGSLYGSWFDWDALARLAAARSRARVVVIGDPPAEPPPLPDNVHLLGLKAQKDLPAYLARMDVGVVPFSVSATTHAVSPLKAFECLAMGVPVAAPPLRALEGIAGVHLAASLDDAVAAALAAPRPDPDAARAAHGWGERLGRMFAVVGAELAGEQGEEARVIVRPVVHFDRRRRRLRPL